MTINVEAYRVDADAYLEAMERAVAADRPSAVAAEELEPIRDRFSGLFDRETVSRWIEIARRGDASDGSPWIAALAVEGHVDLLTVGPGERWREAVRSVRVEHDGREIGWSEIPAYLEALADRDEAERWQAATLRAGEELAGPARFLEEARADAAASVGAAEGWSRWEATRGRRREEVVALAEELISRSGDVFRGSLAAELSRLGLGMDEASWAEHRRFVRAPELDSQVPAGDVGLVDHLAEALGLGDAVGDRISVSLRDDGGEVDGFRAAMVAPPHDIRCFVDRRGPLMEQRNLLRAAGTAFPAARIGPDRPLEARRLGDPALRHAWASLFEGLLAEGRWVEATFRRAWSPTTVAAVRLRLLARVRELAGWVIALDAAPGRHLRALEIPQLASVPTPVDAAGSDTLASATGFDRPVGLLPGTPDGVFAADALLGWLAAPALFDRIARRFGRLWPARAEAGRWLAVVWEEGFAVGLEAVMEELGAGRPAVEPLLDDWLPELRSSQRRR